jgi:DNA-binding MarR family transcriptional regulator
MAHQPITDLDLQEQMIALIRAFGLHRPDQTPCGQPIAVAEAHALIELTRAEPLSQNDLVARLLLTKSTVSRLVHQMEQRGWIARRRSPLDGRMAQIYLTDAGRTLSGDLAEARHTKFAHILAAIPEEQRGKVLESLTILVEAMREQH